MYIQWRIVDELGDLCIPATRTYPGVPFKPIRSKPIDLFPYTPHCELITYFTRQTSEDMIWFCFMMWTRFLKKLFCLFSNKQRHNCCFLWWWYIKYHWDVWIISIIWNKVHYDWFEYLVWLPYDLILIGEYDYEEELSDSQFDRVQIEMNSWHSKRIQELLYWLGILEKGRGYNLSFWS